MTYYANFTLCVNYTHNATVYMHIVISSNDTLYVCTFGYG